MYDNTETQTNPTNSLGMYIDKLFTKILSTCTTDDILSDKTNYYYCPEFRFISKTLLYISILNELYEELL